MEMDAKESVLMVIRATETDSMDRVEDIVGRLIDLFNSDESCQFFQDKIQQARDGLTKLENAMKVSLYDGMQAMRQLVTDVHIHLWSSESAICRFQLSGQSYHYLLTVASNVLSNDSLSNEEKVKKIWDEITESLTQDEDRDKALEGLEEYVHEWRRACKLPEPDKQRLENEIRVDFDRGLRQQHSDIEDLYSQVREHFEGLRGKLESAEVTGAIVGGGITGETAVAALEEAAEGSSEERKLAQTEVAKCSGERFLKRKDPGWYPRIENSLFAYIRGKIADDDLRKLIEDEGLEEDLCHAREHLNGWITRSYKLLDNVEIPVLNKEAYVLEARRTWAFAKALLLGDSEYIEHHNELLSQLINAALSSGDDVAPFISVAHLPDESHTLGLHLVVREGADMQSVNALVCDIAKHAGGNAQVRPPTIKGTHGFEINFEVPDDVKRFIESIFNHSGGLKGVGVCYVYVDEYDVDTGSRLLNPDYNRIYGRGLSAPGFKPTIFKFLDYSGEKYFCPNGWRRVSLNVAKSAAAFDRKYDGWHVAYHGTRHVNSAAILTDGFIPKPGAYSEGKAVVYFSPSIEYAAHPRYARVYEVPDESGRKQYMQMVLQLRVNPKNIWRKVGGTLPGAFDPENPYYNEARDDPPADPNFPENRNLEWLVKPIPGTSGIDMFKNLFVIYGIMIRVGYTDPKTHPANAWWSK